MILGSDAASQSLTFHFYKKMEINYMRSQILSRRHICTVTIVFIPQKENSCLGKEASGLKLGLDLDSNPIRNNFQSEFVWNPS